MFESRAQVGGAQPSVGDRISVLIISFTCSINVVSVRGLYICVESDCERIWDLGVGVVGREGGREVGKFHFLTSSYRCHFPFCIYINEMAPQLPKAHLKWLHLA